jgi:rare lipoprotein A
MRRRLAEGLAVLLSVASLGAGAASGPSSLEAAKVTPQPVIRTSTGLRTTNSPTNSGPTTKGNATSNQIRANQPRASQAKADQPKAYQTGTASWYGEQFQGRQTASGEPFDMRDFTAAHPSLPLGTFVKVTNLKNGKAVVVRINDRGPVVEGRIIDLSDTAAQVLGFRERGVQTVRLDLYKPANRRVSSKQPNLKPATEALLEPVAKLN